MKSNKLSRLRTRSRRLVLGFIRQSLFWTIAPLGCSAVVLGPPGIGFAQSTQPMPIQVQGQVVRSNQSAPNARILSSEEIQNIERQYPADVLGCAVCRQRLGLPPLPEGSPLAAASSHNLPAPQNNLPTENLPRQANPSPGVPDLSPSSAGIIAPNRVIEPGSIRTNGIDLPSSGVFAPRAIGGIIDPNQVIETGPIRSLTPMAAQAMRRAGELRSGTIVEGTSSPTAQPANQPTSNSTTPNSTTPAPKVLSPELLPQAQSQQPQPQQASPATGANNAIPLENLPPEIRRQILRELEIPQGGRLLQPGEQPNALQGNSVGPTSNPRVISPMPQITTTSNAASPTNQASSQIQSATQSGNRVVPLYSPIPVPTNPGVAIPGATPDANTFAPKIETLPESKRLDAEVIPSPSATPTPASAIPTVVPTVEPSVPRVQLPEPSSPPVPMVKPVSILNRLSMNDTPSPENRPQTIEVKVNAEASAESNKQHQDTMKRMDEVRDILSAILDVLRDQKAQGHREDSETLKDIREILHDQQKQNSQFNMRVKEQIERFHDSLERLHAAPIRSPERDHAQPLREQMEQLEQQKIALLEARAQAEKQQHTQQLNGELQKQMDRLRTENQQLTKKLEQVLEQRQLIENSQEKLNAMKANMDQRLHAVMEEAERDKAELQRQHRQELEKAIAKARQELQAQRDKAKLKEDQLRAESDAQLAKRKMDRVNAEKAQQAKKDRDNEESKEEEGSSATKKGKSKKHKGEGKRGVI